MKLVGCVLGRVAMEKGRLGVEERRGGKTQIEFSNF